MDLTEKIEQLIKSAGKLPPGALHIRVKHEAGCPAIKTQRLVDCNCTPEYQTMDFKGHAEG